MNLKHVLQSTKIENNTPRLSDERKRKETEKKNSRMLLHYLVTYFSILFHSLLLLSTVELIIFAFNLTVCLINPKVRF